MKIATWNVNSVRTRLEHIVEWLKENPVDVLLLQELKCQDQDFPKVPFYDLGYNQTFYGQKSYNGVAILSHKKAEDVVFGINNFEDEQARYIEAIIGTRRIISVYVPNGEGVNSQKFDYKLDFLNALNRHLKSLLTYKEEVIIGGDFNIAPSNLDVHDPQKWEGQILCSNPERLAFQHLLNIGYTDVFRMMKPTSKEFTWWDYRGGGYQKDEGLRIDHFLLSPEAADKVISVKIDKTPRSLEKPSDHTPVILELK
ncbi:MAG: exodeoxyribonuclease III [Proteobacteria bacterium]|nr:exodeoxyribonuclease III [Pseudomonadota bacterium]